LLSDKHAETRGQGMAILQHRWQTWTKGQGKSLTQMGKSIGLYLGKGPHHRSQLVQQLFQQH